MNAVANGYARRGRPPKRLTKATTNGTGLRLGDLDKVTADQFAEPQPQPKPKSPGIFDPLLGTLITWGELDRIATPDSGYRTDLQYDRSYTQTGGTVAVNAWTRLMRIRRMLDGWIEAFVSGDANDIYHARWQAFDAYEGATKYGDIVWAEWCVQIAKGKMPEGDFPGLAEGMAAHDRKDTEYRERLEEQERYENSPEFYQDNKRMPFE